MRTTEAALSIIRHYEQGPGGGVALKAYLCSAGVPTIGWGHTKGVKLGDTCTEEQAGQWLVEDCNDAERVVNAYVKVPLTQNEFDACVSFTFNVGAGSERLGKPGFMTSTLLRKLNSSDYVGAAAEFPRWNKAKGKVQNGLVKRRAQERALFEQQ